MNINNIFEELVDKGNSEPLFQLISEIKNNIPISERKEKGIVWTLRQIRAIVQSEVPIHIQKKSLHILLKSDTWEVRKLTSFIAVNCIDYDNDIDPYIVLLKQIANDSHFAIRESAQMSMRELLQIFPDKIIRLYDEEWINDPEANVRRCISESLRPVLVNGVNWVRDKPQEVIKRLERLNKDPSIYVRKSVGNNLADISRRYPELVFNTLQEWLSTNDYHKWTLFIARKASRHIVKTHPSRVEKLLRGYSIIQ